MRALLICLALAACAPAPPPAEAPYVAPPRASVEYICAITNEEAAMYTAADGSVRGPVPTGRDCDYQARLHKWRP